jgi:hypothetical protein
MMTPGSRRFTFTTHVTSSVGWFGAALTLVALAVVGLTSDDEATVRGAYLLMAPAAWFVLVPLAHASLLSGIILSLGTAWGLFRYYWVAVKLGLTVFATAILLIYMRTFQQMAGVAADPAVDLAAVRNASPIVHGILALVVLVSATVLGIYKPFGMTERGRRAMGERRHAVPSTIPASTVTSLARPIGSVPSWIYWMSAVALALVALVVILHLTGTVSTSHTP